MSLSRTALRLAVVEALAPYALHGQPDPEWPTYAGMQIFDSQISPVALTDLVPSLPVVVVSVEAAKTEGFGGARDVTLPGDGKETATLAFEIMVPVSVGAGADAELVLVGPTDAMAKAMLELIEDQIQQRLADARMAHPLCDILLAIEEIEAQPYADPDTDLQISATRLELKCQIRQRERWPQPGLSGLECLPEPLRSVARALPPAGYGGKVVLALAAMIGDRAAFTALNELRLAANLVRSAGETPPAATDASQTPPLGDLGGRVVP